MWNEPTEKELDEIPKFYHYEANEVPIGDQIVCMHLFIGGFDWYIVEYDSVERSFYCFANLNDDHNAEWGYTSFDELRALKAGFMEVDRDMHWTPKKVRDIPEIANLCRSLIDAADKRK